MPDPIVAPPAPTQVSAEEYDAFAATPKPAVKASDFKLEGEDIPEEFRGKTAADIVKEAKAFQTALRLSEDGRAAMKAALDRPTPAAAAPAPVAEPEITREQLKEMYDQDPLAAIETMQQVALRKAEKHLEVRLGQMSEGTASLAENWARQEYPDEFRLFSGDLQKLIDGIPNKQPFSTKKGWEDAIAYVRGQRGNFEKLMDFRTKGPSKTSTEARIEQDASAGFSGANGAARGSIPSAGPVTLDDVQKEIAKEFIASGTFKDEAEYIRWSKLGGA